jgi:hypothetical protein
MRRPYVAHALPACDAGHGSPAADSGRSAAEWTRNLFHEQYLFQPLKALNRFNEKFFTVMLVLRTPISQNDRGLKLKTWIECIGIADATRV